VGGEKQFIDMIQRNYMDMVIYFYNPMMSSPSEPDIIEITRECDRYNIPIATNIATAEAMVLGMERGSLDWRLAVRKES
jgi:methylglyoxal synthase